MCDLRGLQMRPVITLRKPNDILSDGVVIGRYLAIPPGGWRKGIDGSTSQRWRAILFARYNVPVVAAERQRDLVIKVANRLRPITCEESP